MPRGGPRPGAGRKPKQPSFEGQTKVSADVKRQPFFSETSVEAILRAVQERQLSSRTRPRTADWNPYIIRPERFGPVAEHIRQHAPKMAMDKVRGLARDNNVAIQAWQAGGLLGNLVSEGLLFLGYPYLSELAQRPEFRLFGEIRAQEMTRKWIEYRPVTDESTKDKDAENEGKEKPQNPDDAARAREKRQAGDEAPRSDDRNKEIEDKIKELNDAMEEFRVRDWFETAAAQDSFFGISHLYLDIKGTNLEDQRDPELAKPIGNGRDKASKAKLGVGCLRGLRAIEPIWCYPTTYNAVNPLIESWYDPQVWYVMGTEIHKTRLLTFVGRPVPDILKPAYAFGGLAMTQMAQPYVDIWLRTRESVGELIHAFSTMVMMTNLGTTTMPGGSGGGGGDVLARLALFNALRDNQGVFAIDKNTEDFKNVAAPLSGLDELQAQSQEHMFSVGRIPAVKFAGIQPKGLNATSEGEMRAFYDTIIGEQNHLFRPNLTTVSDIIQTHLWGACDKDITFDFVPLWEQTEKEKAEIRKMDAETAQILIDSGQISQEEARRRLATDPESGYHEIDPDDVPDLLEEEEMGLAPPGARGLEGIIGGEGDDPAGGNEKGSRVTPFAESRRKAAASDAATLDKDQVAYVDGWPKAATQCQRCSMFVKPSACTLVKGKINPGGHCRRFAAKGAGDDMPTREQARRQAIVTAGGQDEWRESDHPRRPDGKFGTGGTSKTEPEGGQGELKLEAGGKAKGDVISELLKKGATSKDILGATGWKAINIPRVALALGLRLEKVGNVYKGVPMGPQELEGARLDAKRKAAELKAKKAAAGGEPEVKIPERKGPDTINSLAEEYRAFQKLNNITLRSAEEELGNENLSKGQRDWIKQFSARWNAVMEGESRPRKPPAPPPPSGPAALNATIISEKTPELERFRDRVTRAANQLPETHRALLKDIRIEIEDKPTTTTSVGTGYAGYYNWSGFIRMPAVYNSGMKASNEANVVAHESAHAIDHKYGWALGDMVADQVNADAERMTFTERERAKYWFGNNKERFAELYALTYAPGRETRFFGGMERGRAERIFAKSIEQMKSFRIGEKDSPLGEPGGARPRKKRRYYGRRPAGE